MENIQDLRITPLSARSASKYYHPIRIEKNHNGIESTRETGYGMDTGQCDDCYFQQNSSKISSCETVS